MDKSANGARWEMHFGTSATSTIRTFWDIGVFSLPQIIQVYSTDFPGTCSYYYFFKDPAT